MNRTPDGPAADLPYPSPEESDAADPGSSVPSQRTGLEPLPRRVRGASGASASGATAREPVDTETLNRLLSGLRDI